MTSACEAELAIVIFQPDFNCPLRSSRKLGLTDREAETLLWVAQGKSNARHHTVLGNSEKTVKKTMGHIFEKLGLESRHGGGPACGRGARGTRRPPGGCNLAALIRPPIRRAAIRGIACWRENGRVFSRLLSRTRIAGTPALEAC